MSAFLNWLAGVFARWLHPKGSPVTNPTISLTPAETAIASTTALVVGDLGALGNEAMTFWNALVAAAAAKFGNLTLDAMAGGYGMIVLTQAVADVPSPISGAASMALTVEKLAMVSIPEIAAAGKILAVLAGLGALNIRGADPTLPASQGGFPNGPSGGRTGRPAL
ncbi:MAG: hypothetical protein P4L76_18060 [Beijerinckiaceae bacterium]|nr:hypothetical protein [Beijerinckiaceae bacterium]